ncbi:MAG TPA: type II CAAX endopeptidase family protein [Microlunatus sp.]|nr:type II CAAX endopeptidase family protein [Microlunatus sp.]
MRKFPVLSFVVLAYLLTWWVYPLMRYTPLIGMLGLFGPALAAIIVTALTGGRSGVHVLLRRTVHWRIPLPWYLVAIGLPAALSLAAACSAVVLGPSALRVGTLSVFDLVLAVLVVGEELGWRGYALPKLLERFSPVLASVILGVIWGLWHLPTFFIPGAPQYGQPLIAFVILTVSYSIMLTWLFSHTAGSVLIATLCHGAINVSQGFFLAGIEPAARYWWLALVYSCAALVIAVVLPSTRGHSPQAAERPPTFSTTRRSER